MGCVKLAALEYGLHHVPTKNKRTRSSERQGETEKEERVKLELAWSELWKYKKKKYMKRISKFVSSCLLHPLFSWPCLLYLFQLLLLWDLWIYIVYSLVCWNMLCTVHRWLRLKSLRQGRNTIYMMCEERKRSPTKYRKTLTWIKKACKETRGGRVRR